MVLKIKTAALPLYVCFLILVFSGYTYSSRFFSPATFSLPSSDLVSDGVGNLRDPPFLRLDPFFSVSASSCDQTYGFMPCTSSWIGNLFLIVAYGYLMFLSAKSLSTGSELLLEIMGPGIVGGLFLPMLGALPDALLILVSGLSGSTATAQSQVTVGMGLLAGSTVMLLSIIWGSCVIVGKCDLENSVALDGQNTKGFNLIESGVSTDIWTSYAARIMVISIIPFLVVQIPQSFTSTSGKHLAVLIALIVSLSFLVGYLIYQVLQPWILRRRLDYYKHRQVIYGLLTHLKNVSKGGLLNDEGQPDKERIKKIFLAIDQDKDGYLSDPELRALMVGIQFKEIDFDQEDAVDKVMRDFDTSRDSKIDTDEFAEGIAKWLSHAQRSKTPRRDNGRSHTLTFLQDFNQETRREHDLLDVRDQGDDVIKGVENPKMAVFKAVLYLLLGTIVAAVFADPLVDAVDGFSDATSIPAFFISFIVLPFATNSSEAVSAIIFASRKKRQTASLTFSELYGAATMNNLLCLAVFLALVYVRGLSWDFSAEVLVIVIVCVVMGLFASLRTTFPLWTSFVAFFLYPFSLVLVYILDYIVGWK